MNPVDDRTAARKLWLRRDELARAIRIREGRDPLLETAPREDGPGGEPDDPATQIAHLAAALDCRSPALFEAWVGWARRRTVGAGRTEHQLLRMLECSRRVLESRMPASSGRKTIAVLDQGIEVLRAPAPDPPGHVGGCSESRLPRALVASLLSGEREQALALVLAARAEGGSSETLLLDVLQPALREVGRMWQLGRLGVAEAHHAIATARHAMAQLSAERDGAKSEDAASGTLVAACLGQERHELGVRVVADLLERDGWEVDCLGAGTSPGALVEACLRRRADGVLLSASLGMHLRDLRAGIDALRETPALEGLRVLVGGAPFERVPSLWRRVGADATAADARSAVVACAAWRPARATT